MSIGNNALVIGLTGPFGSGCSTSAEILVSRLKFSAVKLSSEIDKVWAAQHPDGAKASREDRQKLGDDLRKEHGGGVLTRRAVEEMEKDQVERAKIVFDGVRNVQEVKYLRQRFGHRFFLFALEGPQSERWERLKPSYEKDGRKREDFEADDKRDQNEETAWGQQVQLCVDRSDVLVINDDEVTLVKLRKKLTELVRLVAGDQLRFASVDETLMNVAYSTAHGSKCLKRQVGAVLVAAPPGEMGDIVGVGFNENPPRTAPCVLEPKYGADLKNNVHGACYRDLLRGEFFIDQSKKGTRCPKCGNVIPLLSKEPPWKCACGANLDKLFFPERAMTWCTAVHAEVVALLAAGHRARGTTLYTTAFPCFQCTEKLIQAGIVAIVFTEPYPDTQAADRLDIAKIKTARFEGVRSSRFHEIFSQTRPALEGQV